MPELIDRTVAAAAEAHDEDEALRSAAIRRLKKKRDFMGHLFAYLVVNVALWTIWIVDGALNGWELPWPAFVTFFWGLFVLGAANDVYRKKPFTEEEIRREVARIRH